MYIIYIYILQGSFSGYNHTKQGVIFASISQSAKSKWRLVLKGLAPNEAAHLDTKGLPSGNLSYWQMDANGL